MQRILVGVDSSEGAKMVLRRALDLATLQGGRLTIVQAVSVPVEFPIEALSISPDGLPAKLLSATQRGLDRFVVDVPPPLMERAEARLGTAWQVLCDTAKEINAELIVIGTHGHGALDRLLGTTAARVVNHAPCSVLVVRMPEVK